MTSTLTLDITALTAAVRGPVLAPGDADYAGEVAGFNVAHPPVPAVAVGATDAADVSAAVRWAARAGLRVRIQSTGHGLVDDLAGSLLITTKRIDGLRIDSAARTVTVGAGVRWRDVIDAAAPFGLAPLNGSSSSVGVMGYTLGGGMGPMARRYGFAADHVRSFTIVTADGEIRVVDNSHDAALFWAVRGGKVGFGVVTEITVDLLPVSRFFGGGIFFAGSDAAAVLGAWREWTPTLPVEVTTSVALLRLPPDPQLPPPLRGQFVTHLRYAHIGDPAAAEQLIAPMRGAAPVIVDTIAELPYAAIDAVHMDPTTPMPCFDHGLTLSSFPAEAVDALLATNGADSGSSVTLTEIRLLGGELSAAPAVPNSVAGRGAAFSVYVLGVPAGPAASAIPAQVNAVVDALAPWRAGSLVNFLGHAGLQEFRDLWSDADRGRLAAIARHYDPLDTFGGAASFG